MRRAFREKRMRALLLLTAIVTNVAVAAEQQSWVGLTSTQSTIFEGRAGSFEFATTANDREPIAAIIVRMREAAGWRVAFEKKYVTLADCLRGHGKRSLRPI